MTMRELYVLSRGGGWSIVPRAEGMKDVEEKRQGSRKLSPVFALILGVGETS